MPALSVDQTGRGQPSFDVVAPIPDAIHGIRRRRADRSLDVHRRIAASLVDILAARYPITRQMIGEESFAALSRSYAKQFPPISSALARYGASMPEYIRELGSAPSIEYLADVAHLESARAYAAQAPHVRPIRFGAFSRCLTIELHPSASLVTSRFPVVSIWESQIRNDDKPPQWRPEAALVIRPEREVQIWRLPPGGHAFLAALMAGHYLSAAAQRATEQVAAF